MLSETELSEIERRASAATAGPWKYDHRDSVPAVRDSEGDDIFWHEYDWMRLRSQNDGDLPFIAASRTDIPSLLAAVRELQRQRDGLVMAYGPAMPILKAASQGNLSASNTVLATMIYNDMRSALAACQPDQR